MKMHNKKRGFTIVELVIVIAVIAILSAVLIPTFAGIVKKSRRSADETAVAQMNTLLAADDEANDLEALKAMLAENGYDLDNLSPLSKDYSFMYSAKLDKVFLVEDGIIVYPAKYAGDALPADAVTLATDKLAAGVSKNVENDASFTSGGIVAVASDYEATSWLKLEKDVVVNLSATISYPTSTATAALFTTMGGNLTLNGDGTVNAKSSGDYNMAVWAYNGDVVINGGYYTNVGAKMAEDDGTPNNNELIYATNGCKITINGGSFKCARPEYTLNCKNGSASLIIVKGGEFFEFNPETMAEDGTIVVADGYEVKTEVRTDGTWYKVVPSAN